MRAVGLAAAAVLTLAACGTASHDAGVSTQPTASPCSGFEISLVSEGGGRPTPVEAAAWFIRHDEVILPSNGPDAWVEVARDAQGATVRSGETQLRTMQFPDGTWAVVGGGTC